MTEPPEARPPEANVPGYLLPLSILATLFCCLPVGIGAIIFSAQANSRAQLGDYAGASQATRNANIWLIITAVVGILFYIVVFAFILLGIIVASSGEIEYYKPDNVYDQPGDFDNFVDKSRPRSTEV
jgi:hypothetical protein